MGINRKALEARLVALEQQLLPQVSLADRLKAARERWRGLTDEQRATVRAERLARPEPPAGSMRHRLWLADRRVAAKPTPGGA